ncbi:N-acetyl-D-Glu racemase DgcA [Aliiglaciecola sp. NS0011-25]|uniref:N-acetyl-D-Glu racemase DgcA n=1 Tax=Aliiglaciecola sp. NS0011-25 TaxID=3127654 RepID=UPI003104E978
MSLDIRVVTESFPLITPFRISRGEKTAADVVVVSITDGKYRGWAEAVPYSHYGETIQAVCRQLESIKDQIVSTQQLHQLSSLLPAGSARNALDCALWDLHSKQQHRSVAELAGMPQLSSCHSAQTISIDSVDNMAKAAAKLAANKVIKVKLDEQDVVARMQAIHAVCPNSEFIVDANEAWGIELLEKVVEPLRECKVALIEQPLPSGDDQALADFKSSIPICADESCHTSDDLERLLPLYQAVNIKLDKTGGLTEALRLLRLAKQHNLKIMVGCMVGSSLAMAPAYLLAAEADFVDLDGPALIAKDRPGGFGFVDGKMCINSQSLWGQAE